MKAEERIQKILSEIDPDNAVMIQRQSTAHRSAKEIADIILGNSSPSEAANKASEIENNTLAPTGAMFDCQALDQELATANSSWNIIYYKPIHSHRKIIGKTIIFFKRAFRRAAKFLIEPLVLMQNSFNSSVVRALNIYRNSNVVFESRIDLLQEELQKCRKTIEEDRILIESLNSTLDGKVKNCQAAIDENTAGLEQKLTELRGEQEDILKDTTAQIAADAEALCERVAELEKNATKDEYSQIDYFHFENEFRGKRERIKTTLQDYIEYFRGCGQVIDLGSGRGEFLDLLRENNIGGVGVEPYLPFVDYCRNRGLNVIQTDALSFIKEQPDKSLDGIIGIQMIEHISTDYLISLCNECYRALDYGRKLIFETPNPTSVSTFLNSFYLDPSHNKPIHPKFIEYLLRKAGFSKVEIVYTEQSRVNYRLPLLDSEGAVNLAEFNDGINFITDILFGSQDYFVAAEK